MHLARTSVSVLLVLGTLFLSPLAAHAESTQWTETYTAFLYSVERILGAAAGFKNPSVTVEYRAYIEDLDTGARLGNAATVPVGTRLRLAFDTHQYTDITWFATGAMFDSPYGDWRTSPPPVACHPKDYIGRDTDGKVADAFASLTVRPPTKDISGTSGLSCKPPASDGSQICITSAPGTYHPLFSFAATEGHFYPRFLARQTQCAGNNLPMALSDDPYATEIPTGPGQTFVVDVPTQTIPFTIHVIEAPENPDLHTPTTPTLTFGACTAGQPHTITMTSTDPDNNQLRYGIDWDADGSLDQFIPATGYVPSGITQTASRTYSLAGAKTVKVLVQDTNGLTSGWATVSFNCANASSGDGSAGISGMSGTGSVGGSSQPTALDLSLRVVPSLVKRGETTQVHWSTANLASCTVTAPNGDSWSALVSAVGGEISQPITKLVTYTLTCRDANGATHTKKSSVGIVPNWRER